MPAVVRDLFQIVKYESLNFLFYPVFGVDGFFSGINPIWTGMNSKNVNSLGAALSPPLIPSPSSAVVISQVYGGGGNSGATYKNDFIELFNRGDASVDLTGWSVQYAAATGSTWSVTSLSGSLAEGHYYLVKEAAGSGGTTDLPSPDATGNIDLNASAGKVVVVNSTTALSGSCPSNSTIVDMVGYGSNPSCYEGSGAAPSPSNTTSIARASLGCIETDNNATDFDPGSVTPRNSASGANTCNPPTGSATVVISEFRTRGPSGGNDEFVEIYNKSNSTVDISGWKIKASNNAGAVSTRATVAANTVLPIHGHFLVANNSTSGYSGSTTPDQTYTTGISDDGGIAVTTASDTVIDQVGMSSGSAFKENRILGQLTTNANRGYERRPGGSSGSTQDTNDSPSDFQIRTPSDPQNLQSAITPANQLPTASVGGPYNGFVAQNVPFAGSGSDSDGTVVSYSWTFGDGGTGTGTTPTHAYSSIGTYTVTLTVTDNQGGQGSSSTTVNISTSSSDQYSVNFLQWGLDRTPTTVESNYWNDIVRAAYQQGQPSMLMAMKEFGMTVFESQDYADRNRSNHDYVYDLYKSYLMRQPDQEGWTFWTEACDVNGREAVRQAFDESTEFHNIVANLTTSGSPSTAVSSLATAQVDPFNQSGNQVKARDCEWSLPLVSLPGRAGLDLGLSVSYSSLIWTKSGPYLYFDQDYESLSPGFKIGFPTVQFRKFDAQTSRNVYIFTAGGQHIELRQVGTSNYYESADSTYLQLIDNGGSLTVLTTDGTKLTFASFLQAWSATGIEDRNGNLISIDNDWRGDIQNVTDTLGRTIHFGYDNNANLTSITQSWAGESQPHTWATFGWDTKSMSASFTSEVVGMSDNESMPVLTQIALDDGARYNFEYENTLQVKKIHLYTFDPSINDYGERTYTAYDYEGTSDCPRISQSRVWAQSWNGDNDVPSEVITHFQDPGSGYHQMIAPDDTTYKEFYGGTGGSPLWQHGLVTSNQVLTGSTVQKSTTTLWTQDDPDPQLPYQTNPRVYETNVTDGTNHRRTTIGYQTFTLPVTSVSCSLPNDISEYDFDQSAVLRRTYSHYITDAAYLNNSPGQNRIIGLRDEIDVYQGSSTLKSKTTYVYDDTDYLEGLPSAPTQHNSAYSTDSAPVRGNLVKIRRWDVDHPTDSGKITENKIGYDIAGSVIFTLDALNHRNEISYADSFAGTYSGQGTFAYPTTVTDADSSQSSIQYNYSLGRKTRVQGPPPQNQTNGVIQNFTYDSAARLQRVTIANTGAYTHYVYGPYYIQAFSSVNGVAANYPESDSYSIQTFDGLGRLIGSAGYHPDSIGGYKAQLTKYDSMGRAIKQSNPTEVDSEWTPAGDDQYNAQTGTGGYDETQQSYDWKGRPRITTHPDTTYRETSYQGCGCAGGDVMTISDEGTLVNGQNAHRTQKVYSDALGRQWKREVLNFDGTVYSTTISVINARDQVGLVNQYVGVAPGDASSTNESVSCPTESCQQTVMSYDGYGRLKSKHVPEQDAGKATSYSYNSDDTISSMSDARGASAGYVYNNNRHLVNEIHYTAPSEIASAADATFTYDAAGNRISMSDALGDKTYNYNELSQLTSETRTFTGVGSFALNYDYNFAGELNKVTDSTNMTINYGFDSVGRVTGVTGSGSLYAGVSTYASSIQYRAWGGLKSIVDGKGYVASLSYNSKLQPSGFQVSGNVVSQTYDYYNDGRVSFVHNTSDANFDRAYTFDHLGRFTSATSGGQARNGTGDTPFSETFAYDEFSHLTARQSTLWNESSSVSDSGFYANNRRDGWGYDADGRITTIDSRTNEFDAAGRQNSMTATAVPLIGSSYTVNQAFTYDGDGAVTKEVDTQSNAPGSSNTTYHLRSTPLGGAIAEELNNSGVKVRGYVSLPGGQMLASQNDNNVTWKHNTPVGTGEYSMASSISAIGRTEFDPVGADISLSAPPTPPAEGDGDIGAGHFAGIMDARWADFFNPNSGFVVNGHEVTAVEAMFFINFGTGLSMRDTAGMTGESFANAVISAIGPAAFAPVGASVIHVNVSGVEGTPGHQTIEWQTVNYGGVSTFAPVPTAYSGTASIPGSVVAMAAGLQGPLTTAAPRTPNTKDLISRAKGIVAKTDCANWLKKLLAKASEQTGRTPSESSISKVLEDVETQGGVIYGDTIMKAYGFRAATPHGTIEGGNAQIELPTPFDFHSFQPKSLHDRMAAEYFEVRAWDDADILVHESVHLAGYNDGDLMRAAAAVAGVEAPDYSKLSSTERILKESIYWDDKLREHCHP